jgi:hypothetical protein
MDPNMKKNKPCNCLLHNVFALLREFELFIALKIRKIGLIIRDLVSYIERIRIAA